MDFEKFWATLGYWKKNGFANKYPHFLAGVHIYVCIGLNAKHLLIYIPQTKRNEVVK